jgi:hypothetical protein
MVHLNKEGFFKEVGDDSPSESFMRRRSAGKSFSHKWDSLTFIDKENTV